MSKKKTLRHHYVWSSLEILAEKCIVLRTKIQFVIYQGRKGLKLHQKDMLK